ncbi:MAG: MarC family protein [Pseudomonadota bacterium]
MSLVNPFLVAFIPIFVAMDAIGTLPIYVGLVEHVSPQQQRRTLYQAVITAAIAGLVFVGLGRVIFNFLGVTVADFKVAGGLILLILAITDLLFADRPRKPPTDTIGVVPLGMPLIVGPAVLTSLIMQLDAVGLPATVTAFLVNLLLAFAMFHASDRIMRVLGKAGTQGISKIMNLLLAAIGIMMMRVGIMEIVQGTL